MPKDNRALRGPEVNVCQASRKARWGVGDEPGWAMSSIAFCTKGWEQMPLSPAPVRGSESATVSVVPQERCGALVSELAGVRRRGQRSELLAHEGVLEHLAQAQVPVLPFQFGAVMTGPSEVAGDLLAVHQERFLA